MKKIAGLNLAGILLIFLSVLSLNVSARIDAYPFDDPAQEALYKKLVHELRCLVCQNQNLADSNAELALDLRKKTYNMIVKGKSEDEIIEYMTDRYGDFVLYRPQFKPKTAFLWIGPFIIFFIGLFFLIRVIRRRRVEQLPEMSADEKAKAEDLLKSD